MQRVDEIVPKLSAVQLEQVIKLVGRSPRVYPSSTLSPDRCGGSGDTKALRCLSASSVARRQIGLAGAGQDGLAVTVPKNDIASTSVRPQVLSATCTGGTVSNRANIFLRLRRPGCRGNAVQCKRRAWTSGAVWRQVTAKLGRLPTHQGRCTSILIFLNRQYKVSVLRHKNYWTG